MIKIAICEDEKSQQDLLETYIKNIFKGISLQYKLYIFASGEEILDNYTNDFDIVLLDIKLGGVNGMNTARYIRKLDNKVEFIFITSLIDYVLEGYEVRAYRYLLKPINYENLKSNIISCINDFKIRKKHIIINEQSKQIKIDISSIVFIEVQKENITIHTITKIYNTKGTMKRFEKELEYSRFVRCHKSFLINLDYIKSIKQYIAIMENNAEVPISRYRFKETKNKFFEFIESQLCQEI